jgi:hypothetical protein
LNWRNTLALERDDFNFGQILARGLTPDQVDWPLA